MDEDFIIERRMRELRPLFTSSLKEPTLCTHLFSQSVITEQDATKVRTTMQYDTFQASEELMDCVLRSKEPGKWTSFLDALQVTGYEHIRQSLMSPNDDDDERTAHINRTIQHFTKDLAEGMVGDIPIIVPILFSKNILSEVDKDNILSELTNKGGYQAGLMLLDRIKCRAMPTKWYGGFLQALLDANGDELVKLIEPDFIYKGEALFKKVDSRNLDNVAGPEENIYEHVISAAGDVEMDTNNFAVPPVSPRTCSPDVSTSNQPKQIHFDNSTDSSQQNVKQDTFIFRYQYLLIKLGTEVLRKLFDVKTGNDVAKHLIAKRQDIQDLIKAKIITSDQKQLLPPIDNQPDSSNFDISLLACLLRNICGLRHPKDPVWMNPAQGDTSVEADITRLRLCRNQLMHSDKLRLPDAEFESKWKDLSKILIDLNKVCGIAQLKSDIENAKSIDIDERLNGQFNTTIKAWYDSDRQLNQRIDEVSSKINNVRSEVDNVRSEVTNVKSEVTNVKQDLVGVISEVTNMKQDMVAVKRKLDVGSTPQQEIKKQHVESDNDGPENGDESSADNTTRSDSDESQEEPYKLRRYQIELAEHGIKGNNTIVCSETGSGKTFVALEIIKRHFEDKKGLRKVAYMAKTCVLLEHQYGNIDKYLSIKTKLITGEGEDSMQLDMFMNKYDIIFLTPQILVNSLDRQAVKSLSDFSLLIFDECHHTRGDEPYSNLMRKYLVEKFENVHGLPQIVGLTASIGIGKSRNDDEAVDYILKVMACLDVRILSTVEKNIEDLGKFINLPAKETIPLLDDNGPCKNILLEAIEDIENLLLDPALKQHSMVDKILECLDKGSQALKCP